MQILLIDGHALFRHGMCLILRQLLDGVGSIMEAGDFSEGLKIAEKHPDLNLALIELNTPGSAGAICVRQFRQCYPHIPVVVVSGEEDCRVIKEAMGNGADGFVCKSSTVSELLNALSFVLVGGVYMPPQLLHPSGKAAERRNDRGNDRRVNTNDGLTARQLQVLRCLADGFSNKVIAEKINIAEGTVKVHVAAIYQALRVNNRVDAVRVSDQLGLTGVSYA
jgi:DNA-binding NarL/FixJ family response regulator